MRRLKAIEYHVLLIGIWITAGLGAAGGCAASRMSGAAATQPAALSALPPPSAVLHRTLATEAERTALGSSYLADAGLSNRVARLDTEHQAWFGPDFVPQLYPQLDGLAYCVYRLHLPAFNDTQDIVYYWSTPPDKFSDAYIAVGDVGRDVWRWRQCTSQGKFSFASLAPYITAPGEELLLAVAVTGFAPAVLDYIRVGDNNAPYASFTAEPSAGTAPHSVHFDAAMSSDYMGAVTNYEWDLDGDGAYELSGAAQVTADYTYDTAGVYTTALRVSDVYGATGTATVPVTVSAEPSGTWHINLADDGYEETGWYASLLEVEGLPAVAYLDHANVSTPGVVRYIRATDAQGIAWGAPVLIGECGAGGGHVSLTLVEGQPAVSYGDGVARQIMYCRASDATGSAWGSPQVIAPDYGDFPDVTCLAIVAGNPAVMFVDTAHKVRYIRALDTTGAAWPAADIELDGSGQAIYQGALLISGGVPLVFYNYDMWREVRLARAQDATGTAWDAPETVLTTEMGLYVSVAVISGRPALAYVDGGSQDLYYMRADDALAHTWGAAVKLSPLTSSGRRDPCLSIIAGQPAVTYYDQDNGKLLYVRASDTDGAAWGSSMVVDNDDFDTTGFYSSLGEIAGMPAVAYYNWTQGALMFAAMY